MRPNIQKENIILNLIVFYWIVQVKEARSQKATLKAERSELISDNNILWGALSRTIACPCSKCSTSGQSIGNAEELRLENVERMIGVLYMFNFMLYQ